ncbi:MAG: CPBP family intramembrane glutamic endopeptidase [Terracidiphilus sp.]
MASIPEKSDLIAARSRRREIAELAIGYGLIMLVEWTPRPWQKMLWWVAAIAIAVITWRSYEGLKAMGLSGENFFRSLWVVGLALFGTAVAVALAFMRHTLQLPGSPVLFVKSYAGYAIWAFGQQFLLQCFFLPRFLRLLPNARLAAVVAATIFAAAHLPNPILVPVTLFWGFAASLFFLTYRDLYTLAMAHAILGITIGLTVPGPVDHNMRVGLGYLTYAHTHRAITSPQP